MANKINFITGESYKLSELFSGERSIIIPDLQRDYCWGNDNNIKNTGTTGDLVTDFVKGLINQYCQAPTESLNLGLIYGYEVPADHIQICDGQQRLTTLFLLVGMLNKMTGSFRQFLISDFEFKHGDKEPYLSYAIRESSLYFLSDLVCDFFTSETKKVETIHNASWYFTDYDFDPSIKSMLSALLVIERIISSEGYDKAWATSFGNWLLEKVTFLYFDMGNRRNGEETFVIINTTGEPLSAAQNLKPLVINAEINIKIHNADTMWEEMETWFWQKRRKGENDTSDAGFSEFLRWVFMIEQYDRQLPPEQQSKEMKNMIQLILQGKNKSLFPYKEIGISTIYKYWLALKWIYSEESGLNLDDKWLSPVANYSVQGLNAIGQNECFKLLPILKYTCANMGAIDSGDSVSKLNVRRIYEFFNNIMRLDNASRAVNTLVGEAIKIVEVIDDGDLLSLLDHKKDISSQILTKEELLKLELLKTAADRNNLEQLFWKAQSLKIWKGEIMPLLQYAIDIDNFDELLFQRLERLIDDELFNSPMEHEERASLLRRSFIVASEKYEPVKRGRYYSFGWNWSDWHMLLSNDSNLDNIKDFLYKILNKNAQNDEDLNRALADYISDTVDKKDYAEFAEDDYLLSFTQRSSACDLAYASDDWMLCVAGGTTRHTSFFSRRNAYILKVLGGSCENYNPERALPILGFESWRVWFWPNGYRENCVVIQGANVKLDVRYLSDAGHLEIVLKALNNDYNLNDIVDIIGKFEMRGDTEATYIYKMTKDAFNPSEIKSLLLNLVEEIDNIEK